MEWSRQAARLARPNISLVAPDVLAIQVGRWLDGSLPERATKCGVAALFPIFGVATLVLTAAVLASDQRLRALIPRQRPDLAAIGLCIAGAAMAEGPVVAIAIAIRLPQADHGGAVALSTVPVILFFCVAGSLFPPNRQINPRFSSRTTMSAIIGPG